MKPPIEKPIGRKSYGSIAHLPNSRLGPGDHRITDGQARIATSKTRDRHDTIIVQEKVDGSCCSVARKDGVLIPLGRSGYRAATSKYEQHSLFAQWVFSNPELFDWLEDDWRIVGEWLAQAHSTRYRLRHLPFVAFDLMQEDKRAVFADFLRTVRNLPIPATLHVGGPFSVNDAMTKLGPTPGSKEEYGFHGALERVEGAVWRVERQGVVDFLCKYVRADKEDGIYLPEISGNEAIWNWRPKRVT